MRRSWTRPYKRGWFGVVLILLYGFGAGIVISLLISAARGGSSHRGIDIADLMVAIALVIFWMIPLNRLAFVGIYVGRSGLRYRGPVHTVNIPWANVKGVRLVAGIGRIGDAVQARAIWIDRTNEDPIRTVINDKGIDFLGRQNAFQNAFDKIAAAVNSGIKSA
jgi:hypothetical protein